MRKFLIAACVFALAVAAPARAEVGELVLVDPGQFKVSNHQRNHASRYAPK